MSSGVPLEATRFVGRRRELAKAKSLFGSTRLVTLTGVGGVGKTRIAIKLAHTMSQRDGAHFVSLAELSDEKLLGNAVGEALGLSQQPQHTAIDTIASFVGDKEMLLVLDNCEHQIQACAALTSNLLARCGQLRILATSREPLMVSGEATLSIPPMSAPGTDPAGPSALAQYDAVNLFLDRAATAVPEFELTEDNCGTVAALCQTLDGLPLALELAAVRLRALSLDQILTRLTDRYSLLTGGSRNAPARQQTLRSLITWSYDLCSRNEQLLWARLSVFSGGVELDAAEDVCSDDQLPRAAIFELMASLVDKSILIRDEQFGTVRYRLLETIRQYGAQLLTEAGQLTLWRQRHRDFYAGLVARIAADWVGMGQANSVSRLRRDHPNIRVSLEFGATHPGQAETGLAMAGNLYFYWITCGRLSEGRHWIAELLENYDEDSEARIKALCVAASLAVLQGSSSTASELLNEAERISRSFQEAAAVPHIKQARALAALVIDDHSAAITLFEESVQRFTLLRDEGGKYLTLTLLGLSFVLANDHRGVAGVLRDCQELTETSGERWGWSYCLCVVAFDAWRRGDNSQATNYFRESLEIKSDFDDQLGVAYCFEGLACVEAAEKRFERAATLIGAADAIWQRLGISLLTFPGLARFRDQCVRAARRVGDRPYEAARRRGSQMPFDEALAFALERPLVAVPSDPQEVRLTPREREIALLVSTGLSNRDIANQLTVSRRTVEAHVEHVLAKLGFASRTQIAAWVIQTQR